MKKLSATQMKGVRLRYHAEAEQACDAVGEAFGLADVEAARHLESRSRTVVDHNRHNGIPVGLGNQPVETYRAIFGPPTGPALGHLGSQCTPDALAVTLISSRLDPKSVDER